MQTQFTAESPVGLAEQSTASRVEINGIVQGVGFRPFVYQIARRYGLTGWVANTASGVDIHLEGRALEISEFLTSLEIHAPPLAKITKITRQPALLQGFADFTIASSKKSESRATLIAPDISICPDCLAEMFDPQDRRYRYPFINCTNCGPRYTIIDDIPYDRPNTSMKHFDMCPACRAEYTNPENRRFHAQPNACPVCGPSLQLLDSHQRPYPDSDPVGKAAELLKGGRILALKGLGGFHLVVDAQNHAAVQRLRKRKRRADKPFALMSPDVSAISCYAELRPQEKVLLESPQRPIVFLRKCVPDLISPDVSPENRYFGVMLPYTPLHYLLVSSDFLALVMTSANLSEEPIVIGNEEAFERLSGIADDFLVHNRDIYLRSDDSIARHMAGAPRFIRRSRGYVPTPLFLNQKGPPILACGAELKNTVCLTRGNQAFLSQHIGDLENTRAYDFFQHTICHMKRILDISPEIIAHDMHPDYLSTRYAMKQSGPERVAVQHHHAHIAGCMAENGLDGEVIGLSFDGTGYGTDRCIWGGEVLIAGLSDFTRLAHLSYVPMPGGAAAIREPWRMGVSYLMAAYGSGFEDLDLPLFQTVEPGKIRFIREMVAKRINSPMTSSLGRLFDGVAAILGIGYTAGFEGQAAMALENRAAEKTNYLRSPRLYNVDLTSGAICRISVDSIIFGIVKDMQQGLSPEEISTRFHLSLIESYVELCDRIREETGLNRVVLSGGVFQNAILFKGLLEGLMRKGFAVYAHSQAPTNDGGISLGQAVVAAARMGRH